MKNFKRLFSTLLKFDALKDVQCFCVGSKDENSETSSKCNIVYCYCEGVVYSISTDRKTCEELYDIKGYYSSNDISFDVINIDYNYVSDSLTIALKNGDVFSLELTTKNLQCIGSVESGLKAMEWSPDFETVVFGTGQNTIILMSGTFDPITEVDLFNTGDAAKEMVNVGWGKKETQFHGSEGKAAAKAKPVTQEVDLIDDLKTRITWRGDSTLFAVSIWSEVTKSRLIKFFSQDGVFQCSSESLPGLEHSISWRPTGNIVAVTQKLPNKHVVSFIEKNGLRRYDFTLPPNIEVKELVWNTDSSVLCTVCEKQILFWAMNNYHWYLIQQFDFNSTIVSIKWDPTNINELHLLHVDGEYSKHQWMWNVDHTESLSEEDGAFTGVIDGCNILLTPFKKKVIPPPMCEYNVKLPVPVNEITFAPGSNLSEEKTL